MNQCYQMQRRRSLIASPKLIGVKRFLLAGCLSLTTVIAPGFMAPAQSQLFNSPVDQLSVQERVSLRQGKPVVTGANGRYVARILVNSSPAVVWSVMTDYANLAKFMPNMVSSRVIEDNGNRKVVEQEDERQVFLMKVRSRIRSSITEIEKRRVDFKLIDGNQIKTLQGSWKIEPVAPYQGATPNQVLITQVIEVHPKSSVPQGIFYNLFKDSLANTFSALGREINRRTR